MSECRFPPPWSIEDVDGSFVVKASNDRHFVDVIAARVLYPGVVADCSQVLGKTQCVFWVVRMYLRAAARTFRLYNHTHWSTLRCAENKTSRQVIAIPEAVAGDRETHRLLRLELDRTYCMA